MPSGGNITYGVKFDVDKQQLTQLKAELTNLQKLTTQDILKNNPGLGFEEAKKQLSTIKKEAGEVQAAISSAFNPKLGSLNISKLQSELKNLNVGQIYQDFQKAGAAGIQAFNQIPSAVMKTNLQLRESHSLLDKIGTTMTNSIKWGITSRVVNSLADSIQGAWNYTKALDTSLNDIRIVTGKSAEEMEKFAVQANRAAQNLGASTKDYTNAALIYYQQGLDDAESQRRAEITLKTANVTGQSGRETSEQLTAIWNGYKVNAAEAELYIDKVAAVAAGTAADLEEMATGMSKVAAAANAAGVDIDQLNATLATVVSVTREAPETIGSAFKTIYARLGDLSLGKTDEEGVGLGKVSGQLHQLGVEILDQTGDMRDMGDIIEDIAAKWQTWTRAQQQAAAVAMAGKMQYSRLIALFDNWDMYNKALNMSVDAMGTLQEQQDIYMESTKAHLTELSTAWERVFDSFVDNKGINNGIDILTGLTNGLANFIEALGGGGNTLLTFGSIFTNVFSRQISESINATIKNSQAAKYNLQQLTGVIETLNAQQNSFQKGNNGEKNKAIETRIQGVSKLRDRAGAGLLNTDQVEQGMQVINAHATAQNNLDAFDKQTEQLTNRIQAFVAAQGELMTAEEAEKVLISSNSEEYEKYISAIDKNDKTLAIYKTHVNELRVAQEEYKKALEEVDKAEQQYGKRSNEAKQARTNRDAKGKVLVGATKNVSKDLNALGERQDLSGTTLEGLKQTNENIVNNIKTNTKKGLKDIANDIQDLSDAAESAMQDVENDFTQLGNSIEQHSSDITNGVRDQLAGEEKSTGEDENKFFEDVDMTSSIQSVVQMTAAIGQLTSGIQTLINLGSIWKNEDLTTGEKVLQTFMAIGTALPLVINSITTLKTSTIGLSVAMGALETAEGATFSTALTGILTVETALGPVWLVILAITSAVVALGVAINAVIADFDEEKNAAAVAAEQVQEATKSFEECSNAAKKLHSNITDYYNAVDNFNQLTSTAEGYADALNTANEKALELIKTLDLYDNYHYENGLIVIDDQALAEAQFKANRAANVSEKGLYTSQIYQSSADLDYQTKLLQRSVGTIYSTDKNGQMLEGTNNDFVEGWQISKESISLIVSELSKLNKTQYSEVMENSDSFNSWLKELENSNPTIKANTEQISKQINGFQKLVESTNEATQANKKYIDQINLIDLTNTYAEELRAGAINPKTGEVDQGIFAQRASILNQSQSQDRIKQQKLDRRKYYDNLEFNRRGETYTDAKAWSREFSIDDKDTDVTDFLKDIGMTDKQIKDAIGYSNLKTNEDLARAYAKLKNIDISNTSFTGDKFVDIAGNTVIDVSNADKRGQIRKTIAMDTANAYDDAYYDKAGENSTQNAISLLDQLQNNGAVAGKKYGTDWSNAVLNYLSSKGESFDLSSTFARLDPEEVKSMSEMSTQEIQNMLGITDQALEEFGAGTAEQAAEKFQNALKNYQWDKDAAIEASLSKMSDELPEDLSKKKLKEYQEDVKIYASNLMEVAKNSEDVSDQMKYNSDAATAFALRIIKLNKAIDTLADNYKDWSDIIKKSKDYSQEYAEAMYGMRDAIADVYDVSMDYISNDFINEHLKEIEQIANGSEEAIESLRHAVGEEIIVNILLQNEVDETMLENFKNQFISIREQIETAMSGIKVGEDLDTSSFIDKLNTMIRETGMSMEQVNSLMASLKLEPEFTTQEMSVPKKEKITQTVHEVDKASTKEFPDGTKVTEWTATDKVIDLGEKTSEDKVTVYGISGDGTPPQIKSVKKAPDSSYNNYSSVNKGGKSPGSGKKGGSSSKPSKEKPMDKKTDPYHDVNIQLALTNSKLKMVQSQTDKAFGADKIRNYNNQLRLLNQQLDQTKQKLKIAQSEQNRLGGLLAARGATFNADGTIANYEQLYKQELAKVNAIINNYNGMSKEQQESYKDTLDAAKEDFSKFEEQLKDYDDTVSSIIPELQQNIQDAIDEQIELNIKKFNMEFEIRLDMTEAKKDWNEFKKKVIDGIKDDDIFGNARARAIDDMSVYLDPNGKGQLAAGLKQTQEVLNELRQMDQTGWSSVYGDNRTQALEDLQTAYKDIEQSMLEMQQIQDDVHQAWLDTMDEINEKMSDQVAMYEQINNIIEHDKKIIEMVYGETDFDALGRMYEKQHQNNLGLLDFQKQNAEFWEREMNSIVDKNSDAWKKAKENWVSAINDLNTTIEDSISLAREKLENAIDGAFDKFNKQITNGKGLEYVKQQWDLINDVADDYLDTVNASFGIRELERKYQNAIDNTDNVSSQRKLNELMQKELSQLRDKDKLTEYDIERAKKRYELELKRLDLEEAQNTKTKMRLRRDSQGNYRYEYIADEDNVKKLQDEIDALENSLYNFDKERFISLQNEIVGYVQDRENAIKEIQMDASLTEEERQARIAEINRLYNTLIQDVTDQTVTAQTNLYQSGADELNKIWGKEGKDFSALNQEQQRIMVEEMIPQFASGVHDMIEQFKGPDGFEKQTTDSMTTLSQATQDYTDDLKDIQDASGETFDDVEEGIDKNIPKTEDLIEANDELHDQYQDQIDAIKELNSLLDANIQKYKNIAEAAKSAATEAHNYWMKEQQIASEKAAEEKKNQDSSTQINNGNNNNSNNNSNKGHSGSSNRILNENTMSGIAGAIWVYGSNASGWGTGATRKARLSEKFGAPFANQVQDYINSHQNANNWKDWNQLKNYYYSTFRTGGYTGDWVDDDGKLAVLHKKELVLNAHDTENMLNMMQIARDVIAAAGPNMMSPSAGRYYSTAASDILEQNVHIEANFPNVESASEIKEALNNLVNLAAQRANRKNR